MTDPYGRGSRMHDGLSTAYRAVTAGSGVPTSLFPRHIQCALVARLTNNPTVPAPAGLISMIVPAGSAIGWT